VLFARARKQVLARTGGRYPAPLRALEAIEEGLAGSLEAGLSLEARLASELLVSPVSKNLVHVFKLLEGVKKSPWAEAAAGAAPIERVAVLGAGVMGGGIASLLASAGLWVRLKDLDTARVAGGLAAARRILERRLERRKLDRPGLRRAMSRIAGTTDDSGLGRVELVVEAIVEDREAKKGAFVRLDALAPATAYLATNTSALSVAEIAPAVRDQRRVAGLHFFNPVERMPLVEIVRAPETSDETVAALYALALRLDKKPVVVRDGPGFLVNRILARYLDEAAHLYAEGVEVAGVDEAMTSFGMPVGPFALLDDVGLDVAAGVARVMAGAFPARMEPGPVLEVLRARGRTGRKAGRGFYLYEGTKRKGPDPALRSELGHPPAPRALPPAVEIEHRLIYPMVDEASRCLAEGVVESAAQVDLAMIAGTGFPPFRGGLLRYADAVGVGGVYGVLERLAASAGPRLSPSSSLREAAARGGFYAGEDPARPELL
jgi:3-hydroxyacyl-CoA dehydrogenase/enoyl-CoA hydratase/3-hydroxybutyryl-CoA epimerase